MRINGFEQIKGFYSWVFENQDKNVRTTHISLYMFLVNQNNRNMWVEWFKCPFDLAMGGSGITNKNTYYKTLTDLQDWELIQYKKGVNNYKAPLIRIEVLFDTSTVPQSEPQQVPQSIPLTLPLLQPQMTNNIKLLTDNLELITFNINEVVGFLNNDSNNDEVKDASLYYKNESEFLKDWNNARVKILRVKESNITKLASHELTDFNLIKNSFAIEDFKNGMRGLLAQKDMFPSNTLRPKHFLSDMNIEKYIDAYKNNKQLYENKNKYDVKL